MEDNEACNEPVRNEGEAGEEGVKPKPQQLFDPPARLLLLLWK